MREAANNSFEKFKCDGRKAGLSLVHVQIFGRKLNQLINYYQLLTY